jgi:Zn-dependent protease
MNGWLRQNLGLVFFLAVIAFIVVVEGRRHHVFNQTEGIFFLVLIPSIILHEISHGLVAYWCGDDTAKQAGRLSLNPIRHVSVMGTIIVPLVLIFTTGAAFGWAKPVPVRIDRLRHPRNQAVLVGLAGPATNLIIAGVAAFVFRYFLLSSVLVVNTFSQLGLFTQIVVMLGYANVIIAAFNLLPIPPLDGAALIERVLPQRLLPYYYQVRMGFLFVVMAIVFLARNALGDVFNWCFEVWLHVAGAG